MKEIKHAYIDFAQNLHDDEEKENLVQELAVSLKMDLKAQLDEFVAKEKDKLLELDYWGIYFELEKLMLSSTDDFFFKTSKYRKYSLLGRDV
jgi:hypothetical protein